MYLVKYANNLCYMTNILLKYMTSKTVRLLSVLNYIMYSSTLPTEIAVLILQRKNIMPMHINYSPNLQTFQTHIDQLINYIKLH